MFFLVLLIPLFGLPRAMIAYLLIASALFSCWQRVRVPPPGLYRGQLECEVIDRQQMRKGKNLCWKVTLSVNNFWDQKGSLLAKGVRATITTSELSSLRAGAVYRFFATVHVDEKNRARLFLASTEPIHKVRETLSLVEWRLSIRRGIERVFSTLFKDLDVRSLAGAMTLGLFKTPALQESLNRVGLGHLLAISGFHFGCVVALVLFITHWCGTKLQFVLSLSLISLYFILVGFSPSILRAFCAATLLLLAKAMYRQSSGLNSLGLGLIVILLYDPAMATHVGLHLSFLATAALLLYSPSVRKGLEALFVPRSVEQVLTFSWTDQILTGILYRSIPLFSIIIPVWAVVSFYQMAFFQECSLLGLIYNLALPLLFSLSIPFVLLALLFSPISLLGKLFATVATAFLKIGLQLINAAPHVGSISVSSLPLMWVYAVFVFIIIGGIALYRDEADGWKACL